MRAQSSSQKGVLWWAAHHRVHHKLSDQPGDVHSPVQNSFWYAHVGWLFAGTEDTRWDKIRDFAKYPELRWLNKYWAVPPTVLAISCGVGANRLAMSRIRLPRVAIPSII